MMKRLRLSIFIFFAAFAAHGGNIDFPRDKIIQTLRSEVQLREKAQRDLREQYLELAQKMEELKPEAMGNYGRWMSKANDLLDRQKIASEEREVFESLLAAAQEEVAYKSCREFLQRRLTHMIAKAYPTSEPLQLRERIQIQKLMAAKAALTTASGNGLSLILWFGGYLRKNSRASSAPDLEMLASESQFENGVDSEKAKTVTLEDAGDYVDEVLSKKQTN